jgi:hypothetical protein
VKNRIGDAQLTIEFLGRYKPLEIERNDLVVKYQDVDIIDVIRSLAW